MRKANEVIDYVGSITPLPIPIDKYDLAKVPGMGDTIAIQQKELFEQVHANLAVLEAFLAEKAEISAERAHGLRDFFKANLRKAVFVQPASEKEIQDIIEQLMIGRGLAKGIDYDRETGRVKVSIKEVVPDFILPMLATAIEVKLAKTETKSKVIVDEINSDIQSYSRKYRHMIFVVYDLGTIRDSDEFCRDLEAVDGVSVALVKH